jgi:hypothetical protein
MIVDRSTFLRRRGDNGRAVPNPLLFVPLYQLQLGLGLGLGSDGDIKSIRPVLIDPTPALSRGRGRGCIWRTKRCRRQRRQGCEGQGMIIGSGTTVTVVLTALLMVLLALMLVLVWELGAILRFMETLIRILSLPVPPAPPAVNAPVCTRTRLCQRPSWRLYLHLHPRLRLR